MKNVGIAARVNGSFDEVLATVVASLKEEGFGVLTEIDVRETMKKKLDVEFRRYKILGACNPPLAYRALQAELEVGLMLPCNVIVYEGNDDRIHVSAIDPMQTVAAEGAPGLAEVAREVRERLARVMGRVAESGGAEEITTLV